jgi:outer membrane biosynthesis protein TonB
MPRRAATALHLALILLGAALYIVFVLPRWWVLTGDVPSTPAAIGRIAAGVPIALAAVPIMLNLRQALQPGLHTPELALRLRAWSAVLHVVAGVLIILTAIAEIWLGLGAAGPWLFAVYGAAAAIAILGVAAFFLSRVAEKPPAAAKPPKPAKPAKEKKVKRRARKRGSAAEDSGEDQDPSEPDDPVEPEDPAEPVSEDPAEPEDTEVDDAVVPEDAPTENPEEPPAEVVETPDVETEVTETEVTETADVESAAPETVKPAGLRNKRPTGKVRNRRPG